MGFFSKVIKKVKKVVSKVASSPIGKVALAAAAIYTGGAALGAWGTTAAATAGGTAALGTYGSAGYAAGLASSTAATAATAGGVAASSGGFFSSVKSGLDALSAASQVSGLLGSSSTQSIGATAQGGVSQNTGPTDAQLAAQEEEDRKKRKGSSANVLTSPLGLTGSGQSAAQALLGA